MDIWRKKKFTFKLGLKNLNLESLFFPHLQKYEGGKYQFETGGAGATSKGRVATTSKGNIKVLEIQGAGVALRRSKNDIE
jgi:hypothetical protein